MREEYNYRKEFDLLLKQKPTINVGSTKDKIFTISDIHSEVNNLVSTLINLGIAKFSPMLKDSNTYDFRKVWCYDIFENNYYAFLPYRDDKSFIPARLIFENGKIIKKIYPENEITNLMKKFGFNCTDKILNEESERFIIMPIIEMLDGFEGKLVILGDAFGGSKRGRYEGKNEGIVASILNFVGLSLGKDKFKYVLGNHDTGFFDDNSNLDGNYDGILTKKVLKNFYDNDLIETCHIEYNNNEPFYIGSHTVLLKDNKALLINILKNEYDKLEDLILKDKFLDEKIKRYDIKNESTNSIYLNIEKCNDDIFYYQVKNIVGNKLIEEQFKHNKFLFDSSFSTSKDNVIENSNFYKAYNSVIFENRIFNYENFKIVPKYDPFDLVQIKNCMLINGHDSMAQKRFFYYNNKKNNTLNLVIDTNSAFSKECLLTGTYLDDNRMKVDCFIEKMKDTGFKFKDIDINEFSIEYPLKKFVSETNIKAELQLQIENDIEKCFSSSFKNDIKYAELFEQMIYYISDEDIFDYKRKYEINKSFELSIEIFFKEIIKIINNFSNSNCIPDYKMSKMKKEIIDCLLSKEQLLSTTIDFIDNKYNKYEFMINLFCSKNKTFNLPLIDKIINDKSIRNDTLDKLLIEFIDKSDLLDILNNDDNIQNQRLSDIFGAKGVKKFTNDLLSFLNKTKMEKTRENIFKHLNKLEGNTDCSCYLKKACGDFDNRFDNLRKM